MRLISRTDTPLAAGLVIGALILFHQPLRFVLDWARTIEGDYHLDLVPALVTLTAMFAFHQLRKRRQTQTEMMTAASEARQYLARTHELEALVAFGRTLATAVDVEGLRHAVSGGLPGFVGDRGMWVLVSRQSEWHTLSIDPVTAQELSREDLERTATLALLARQSQQNVDSEGVVIESSVCFPLVVGTVVVGVMGVRQSPVGGQQSAVGGAPSVAALDGPARRGLGVAAAVLSIAIRNVNLLIDTREVSVLDPLTGCLNRKPGLELLETELRRARRSGQPLSVLMLDVDKFKQINDRYGHLCGDFVLGTIGRHLVQALRGSDVKCRYGGDEFILVLPETPLQGAQQVAAGIRKAINAQPIEHEGRPVLVSVSIGVTCAEPSEVSAKSIIDRADRALYAAKDAGRNRSCSSADGDTAAAPASGKSNSVANDLGLTA